MELKNLEKLFLHELKDLYSAENQILEALPEMIEEASDDDLRKALDMHRDETREQVARLDEIFEMLGEDPGGQKCEAMASLIEEGEKVMKEADKGAVRDAGIIASAQRVEHYEIAGYGTAATYAEMLEQDDYVELMEETLEEEKSADKKLTKIAKRTVNPKARAGAR